jgi:sulfide:quinone oxidoreductase
VLERHGVVWAWSGRQAVVGELTFGPGYLTIEGRRTSDPRTWVGAEQLASVRRGQAAERLRDLPTLLLQVGRETLSVAPFQTEEFSQIREQLHDFSTLERPAAPLRLLVAGGGVAGLETALAVHEQAHEHVETTLLSAGRHFTYRPLMVMEPFGGRAPRVSLERFADEAGAAFELGTLVAVDPSARTAMTTTRGELDYDLLVVALGATERSALDGAFTFGTRNAGEFAQVLGEIQAGRLRRVAFVVPRGVVWALPLYELALLTARRVRGKGNVAISLVTSERAPLGLLGSRASAVVGALLSEHDVQVLAGRTAVRVEPGSLVLAQGESLEVDRVVALPRLEGPYLPGLPHDAVGYLPTDRFGHVGHLSTVLAAGDATAFPIKQGGIAAQQADVVASVVAARAGVAVVPAPFEPVLEAQMLTENGPLRFRARIEVGVGEASTVSFERPSERPGKIVARRLSAYLDRHLA